MVIVLFNAVCVHLVAIIFTARYACGCFTPRTLVRASRGDRCRLVTSRTLAHGLYLRALCPSSAPRIRVPVPTPFAHCAPSLYRASTPAQYSTLPYGFLLKAVAVSDFCHSSQREARSHTRTTATASLQPPSSSRHRAFLAVFYNAARAVELRMATTA